MTTQTKDTAKDQARLQFESIREMVAALKAAREAEVYDELEKAEEAIQEDALSVQVRSEWHEVGQQDVVDAEFEILLCTGGPAVRIRGDLENFEPANARLEYQDWGTRWTEYRLSGEEQDILLDYCRVFYFGD